MSPEVLESEGSSIETISTGLGVNLENTDNLEDLFEEIRGKDPGPYIRDPEGIKRLSEIDLFLEIYDYNYQTWYIDYLVRHGWLNLSAEEVEKEQKKYLLARDYCIYQTKKFGTGVEGHEEGKHLTMGEDYVKWFKFYQTAIDKMSDEKFSQLAEAIKKGRSIKKFFPRGGWKNYKLTERDLELVRRLSQRS